MNLNVLNILKLKSPFIEKAISESCKIKKNVVENDEKEKNSRKVLNFGHTFSHAYEATLGYSKRLNHGEAVLLGINTALRFSLKNQLLKNNEYDLILKHFNNANLPSNIKKNFSINHLNRILSFMLKDKKNYSNKINLILLRRIGLPIINRTYNLKNLKTFLKQELSN